MLKNDRLDLILEQLRNPKLPQDIRQSLERRLGKELYQVAMATLKSQTR
jgi:hypothetical protein